MKPRDLIIIYRRFEKISTLSLNVVNPLTNEAPHARITDTSDCPLQTKGELRTPHLWKLFGSRDFTWYLPKPGLAIKAMKSED